jgi:hypothetical protein
VYGDWHWGKYMGNDLPLKQPKSDFHLGIALVALFPIVVAGLFVLNHRASRPIGRSGCINNLKQIGIALLNYQDTHKEFPPAFFADADGKPIHSWRVILLPYFESDDIRQLYAQYNFRQPWNSPDNRRIADKAPYLYRCPGSEAPESDTSYVAVVGADTGWPAPMAIDVRDITDGTSNTISVVEVADAGIHWMEPRDLTFDQASAGIGRSPRKDRISSPHHAGANCLFFDCWVHFLVDSTSPDLLRGLLTRSGGEPDEPPVE